MNDSPVQPYRPMTLVELGAFLAEGGGDSRLWRLIMEFLEEYRWESPDTRFNLLEEEPASTGDEHWDVFLAALAEHLTARDGRGAPAWTEDRSLEQFWFPLNTRWARVNALVHAPAAFRKRGVYVADHDLEVA